MNEYENEELDAMAEEAAEREEMELAEAETPEEADATAADEQEATATPPEQNGVDEDAPEAETPQNVTENAKPKPPTMEEKMLEMLLREKRPDTLNAALANGKTIRGAWNYVVSVMKNAYIAQYGRHNGGMCGNADVVCEIAERYMREFDEGYLEPEAAHTPKRKSEAKPKDAKAEAVKTVKAAAKAAKKEAKQTKAEKVKALFGDTQLSFNF